MHSRTALALVLLLAGSSPALASVKKSKPAKPAKAREAEGEAAAQAEKDKEPAGYRPDFGPKKIDLGHDLSIDLPESMLYIDKPHSKEWLEKNGNIVDDTVLLGMVAQEGKSWVVTIKYFEEGYVKDDDAADFKANDILDNIREGNEEGNELRKERGYKPVTIDGWTEPPRYERAAHHLVWGLKLHDPDGVTINFYTRILGRRGYVALNLLDAPERIEASKIEALAVLKATKFATGARYEDFDKKTDKIAEYGLAALVAGGAGAAALKFAKVGLLAKFGGKLIALLIAFKKLVVVFVLGLLAFIKRLFGRGPKADAAPADVAAAAPPPPPPPGDLPPPGAQP
jgi:uncharacterized membrane-anchored protein